MRSALTIGRLQGGGLVLSYRCHARCRHCIYGSGPHRRDGTERRLGDLEHLLDLLADRAPDATYHIGGGEPLVDLELLERAIRGMNERWLDLQHVETNAAWAKDEAQVRAIVSRLAAAGLDRLMVSVSPFHAEFIPIRQAQMVIDAAERLLPNGALVWIPFFLRELSATLPAGGTLDLASHLGELDLEMITLRYKLVPRGRAARLLHQCGVRMSWKEAASQEGCARRLGDTSQFNVDLEGNYVPGLCPGLILPINAVPGEIDLDRYPILSALARGGPAALLELASAYGFEPAETYSGPCDLCGHVRDHLAAFADYEELGPSGYYDERTVTYARSGIIKRPSQG